MARQPIAREALRPVASPVDTYVNPGPNRLQELAQSLAPLDKELRSFMEERTRRGLEADAIRGEAAFHQANGEGFAEGVRSGRIPAHHSQTFMRSYKQAEGQAMGVRLQAAYASAWDSWGGKNEEDPDGTKFDGFFQEFVRSNVQTQDPDVLAGLLPVVRGLGGAASENYTRYRSDQAYSGSLTAHLSGLNGMLDEADATGLADGTGTNYDAAGVAIEQQRAAFVQSGGKPEDFDQGAMNAVAGKAIELKDPGLLAFFDRTVPGQTYTYGQTPYGQALKQRTIDSLEGLARQSVVDGDRQAKAESDARLGEAQRAAIDIMVAGGSVPEEVLTAGEREDPLFRTKIGSWRESLSQGQRDPGLVRSVMADIMSGRGMRALVEAAPNITSPEDLTQLHTFAKSFEDNKAQIEETLGSPTARGILDAIEHRTKIVDITGYNPITGLSNTGLQAQHDYRMLMQEWVIQNPDASFAQREEAAQRFGKTILDNITPADMGEEATYASPEEAEGFGNPRRPDPMEGVGPGDRAWLDGQGAETTAAIQELARRTGRPLSDVVGDLRGRTEPAQGDATVQPMSYRPDEPDTGGADDRPEFTPEMAEEFLSAVFGEGSPVPGTASEVGAAAGQTGQLLGLIRRHEATGNYNAVYGNAKSTRDLSAFTLDQILGQQQAARRRGVASTAIGAYQFIFRTLRGLKDEMGLSGSERFTPQLQDRLAMQLLERRGYSAFRSGRITRQQFARRLSQEWASLPDPTTGRSYYDGDGLNQALTTTQSVYSALGFGAANSNRPTAQPVSLGAPQSLASPAAAYANIPEAEREQFLQWNPDPVANHEANLASIEPDLSNVVRGAQEIAGVPIVVGSGRRDAYLQAKAVEWGWSKTHDSDHLHGGAVDLWGLDPNGAVTFDPETQAEIVRAMKQAAQELGVDLDVGADWRRFKDNPHFALKGRRA